jgi:hypothetical protein
VFTNFAARISPEIHGTELMQAILRLLHALPSDHSKKNEIKLPIVRYIFHSMLEYICSLQDTVTETNLTEFALSPEQEMAIMIVAERLEERCEIDFLIRLLAAKFCTISNVHRQRVNSAPQTLLCAGPSEFSTHKPLTMYSQKTEPLCHPFHHHAPTTQHPAPSTKD